MATLKDVAQIANVDISTVSRALNDFAYVHPETKKRIFAAAKDLSYQPNLLAKGLKQGKRNAIGIVVPSLSMSVFSDIIESVGSYARERGYALLIAVTRDNADIENDSLIHLRAGFADGVIIASTGQNLKLINEMESSGTHFVQVIRGQHPDIPSVVADYYTCGYDAVKFLYEEKGCRNIGFVNGHLEISPYIERYNGYAAAVAAYNIPEIVYNPREWKKDYFDQGFEGILALSAENPKLDSLITSVDLQAMGALRAMKENGIKIPDKIKLISLTGNSSGKNLETTITALELPYNEVGKQAAELLINTIENMIKSKTGPQHITLKHTLVERETT
ncbi:MAG: LacI family transcriptional regulator [Clostridiales bacterium]|nr:LacI family transcriptional regulator [Clostridiales bacterium]